MHTKDLSWLKPGHIKFNRLETWNTLEIPPYLTGRDYWLSGLILSS